MEKIFDFLGWTNGQIGAFRVLTDTLSDLFRMKIPLHRLFYTVMAAVELFNAAAFKTPIRPYGETLNLDGYKIVMEDNFDGDRVDKELWYFRSLGSGNAGCGFNAESQAAVKNGKLILTGEYLNEQEGKYGAGWYSAAIALNQWYTKGYFEISCICNKDKGFWSAFWLQSSHSYDEQSAGGIGGAEIDILEATSANAVMPKLRNSLTQTVYCNGTDDDPETIEKFQFSAAGRDIFNQFNTYGVLWTDSEYIFYVNGRETMRTSFGKGVSQAPENLIVSLEIPSELPQGIADNHDYQTQMIVDYVRVYQLAE